MGGGTLVSGKVVINKTDIPNAVVYLLPDGNATPPISPMERTMIQEELQFSPAFSIVTTGSTLYFENRDDKIHNVRSNSPSNRFDIGTHLPNTIKKIVLKNRGIVGIQCKVHPEMTAMIFVSPSMHYAKTDSKGRFEIHAVPPGRYTIETWHHSLTRRERAAGRKKVDVGDQAESVSLTFTAKGGLEKNVKGIIKQNWDKEVKLIQDALEKAFSRWQKKKHTSATTKVMRTQSSLYKESGLRNAIAKSLGEPRALAHEKQFDNIRKGVQGLKGEVAPSNLRKEIDALVSDLKKDTKVIKGP